MVPDYDVPILYWCWGKWGQHSLAPLFFPRLTGSPLGSSDPNNYYSDIARLEFTGRDTAAGKSFELWVKKYYERKARDEKNISLEPEPLDE